VKHLPIRHVPQSCHWSVPTLLMPRPYWLAAGDSPWCCWNQEQIVVLTSTEVCETCPLWKRRRGPETLKAGDVPRKGALPFREP
jgi:hypothetical protein